MAKQEEYVPLTAEELGKLQATLGFCGVEDLDYDIIHVEPGDAKQYSVDWEKQARENTSGDHLIDDIRMRNLLVRPVFWQPVDRVAELLQGHCRIDACLSIKKDFSDDYKRLFPKGVPCILLKGISEDMALGIRADHDLDFLKKTLGTKYEAFRLVRPLFDKGWSEHKVILTTWRTVSRILSTKYDEIVAEQAALKTDLEKRNALFRSQKGNFQFLKRMVEAPNELVELWRTSMQPVAEGEVKPMKFTQDELSKLSLTFKAEVEAGLKAVPAIRLTKENPGSNYKQALADLSKKKADKSAGAEPPAPKALNKKQRDELQKRLHSAIAINCINAIAGNEQAIPLLLNLDRQIAIYEAAGLIDFKGMDFLSTLIVKFGKIKVKDLKAIEDVLTKAGYKAKSEVKNV